MKTQLLLSNNDLDVIAAEIAAQHDDITSIYIDINGHELNVLYDKETTFSRENDYFNGTGAYNISCTYLNIRDVVSCDIACDVYYDHKLLTRKVKDIINY